MRKRGELMCSAALGRFTNTERSNENREHSVRFGLNPVWASWPSDGCESATGSRFSVSYGGPEGTQKKNLFLVMFSVKNKPNQKEVDCLKVFTRNMLLLSLQGLRRVNQYSEWLLFVDWVINMCLLALLLQCFYDPSHDSHPHDPTKRGGKIRSKTQNHVLFSSRSWSSLHGRQDGRRAVGVGDGVGLLL